MKLKIVKTNKKNQHYISHMCSEWYFLIISAHYCHFFFLFSKFCTRSHSALSTNSSLCCHSTSCSQTPSFSHLFTLSWEPCLSPYSLYILLSNSPLLLSLSSSGVSCHFPSSQRYILEQTIQRWKWNMDRVKKNIDTGGSRILHWQWNVSVTCTGR